MFLFRPLSDANDEPPDTWDEDEQQEEEEEEKEEKMEKMEKMEKEEMETKETHREKDKDLEFLLQEVSRDSSLDDRLKRDLQNKQSDSKYREMLVSVMLG